MNHISIRLRGVALFTALCVAFSGTTALAGGYDLASSSISLPTSVTSLASESLQVSNKLGRLESFHQGSGPMIVHIQTAHGHYEAQKKIESILNQLEKEQGITTVLVEGSWEKLYPEILNFFPEDPKQTQKLNDLLARKAVVQGPELYLLNSKKAQGFGIEDEKAYLKNADDFVAVVKAREGSRKFLAAAVEGIEKIASAYLSRELRDFLRREEGFQNGIVSLQDWLEELKRQVQTNYGEDLSDAGFQAEWPMLVRYFTIQNLQTKINLSTFDSEKKTFLSHLKSSVSLQSLVVSLEQLLNPNAVHSGLQAEAVQSIVIQMMRALPNDFNYDKYPSVKALIGVLLLQSEIDAKLLMQEIEKLTGLIAEKMTKSEVEKKIVDVYQRKILLSKLLALELTPSDYEAIVGGQRSAVSSQGENVARGSWPVERFKPSVLLNEIQDLNAENRVRETNFEGLESLDAVFEKALKFYAGAKARDKYMIENIELAIQALGVQKVAVVTGGFHAGPFQDYFKSRGYSYGLIMPAISQMDEEGRQTYLQGMVEQNNSLVKSATIERISVTTPTGSGLFPDKLEQIGELNAASAVKKVLASRSKRSGFISRRTLLKTSAKSAAALWLWQMFGSAQDAPVVPTVWPPYTETQVAASRATLVKGWLSKTEDEQLAALTALDSPYLAGVYAALATNRLLEGAQVSLKVREKALGLLQYWFVDNYRVPVDLDRTKILLPLLQLTKAFFEVKEGSYYFVVGKMSNSGLAAPLHKKLAEHIDALTPRELKPGDVVVNKKTGEKVVFGGEIDKTLFESFENGGTPAKVQKLIDEYKSKGVKKSLAEAKEELSKDALSRILYTDPDQRTSFNPASIQYVNVLFDIVFQGIVPANLTKDEFKNLQKLALIGLTAIFYNYQFPNHVADYFLFGLKQPGKFDGLNGKSGEAIFKDAFLKPYAFALVSELVDQYPNSPEMKKLADKLAVYQFWIAQIIKAQLEDHIIKINVTEDWQNDLKTWYVDTFKELMTSVDFITPRKKVWVPITPTQLVAINESQSYADFDIMVSSSRMRTAIRKALWKLLKDKKLFGEVERQPLTKVELGLNQKAARYIFYSHALQGIANVDTASVLQEFEEYLKIQEIPVVLKGFAEKSVFGLKESLKRKPAAVRSEIRVGVLRFDINDFKSLDFQRLARNFTNGIYALKAWAAGIVMASRLSLRSLIAPQQGAVGSGSAFSPNVIAAANSRGQVILTLKQMQTIALFPEAFDGMITYFAEASRLAEKPMLPVMTENDGVPADVIALVQLALDRIGSRQAATDIVASPTVAQVSGNVDRVGYISLAQIKANNVYQLDVRMGNLSASDQAWGLAGLVIKLHSEGLAYQATNAAEFEKLSDNIMQRLGITLEKRGGFWTTTLGVDWIQSLLTHSIISKSA